MDYLVLILCAYLTWSFVQALHFITKNNNKSTSAISLPPGPPPLPVIGNLLDLSNLPHKSLAKFAQTYGPIISLRLGSIVTIVISSPTLAREIFQTHGTSFPNRMVPDTIAAIYQQDQLGFTWMPVSPQWRTARKICNLHILAAKKLDSTQHLRRQKVQELLIHVKKCARSGDAVDIGEATFRTSLNFLSNTIFSLDLADSSSASAKEFKDIVWKMLVEGGKPNLADYFPVLKKFDPQGSRRRMKVYSKKLLDLFDKLIKERVKLRAESNSPRMNDVLDTLLDISEDKNEDYEFSQIMPLVQDLFIAGTETTSSTVEWAMTELLRNPEKLTKAQAELHQVIGKGSLVDESEVSRLPYLQAIVKETLRLHPPVPLTPRKSGAQIQVGGFTIPKNAQVWVNVWAIGRDPAVWEDPNDFSPERFLGSTVDVKGQSFELTPFGGGRRICPGLPLALRMLHLMLGSLINCFDWKLEDGIDPETMNMEDKCGLTLQRAETLKAVPVLL